MGGKRGKKRGQTGKISASEASPAVQLGRGKGHPFPSPDSLSGSLRSLIVSFATPIFSPFSPNAEPGPKLGLLVISLWVQSLNFQNCRNAKLDWRAFWVNDQGVVGKKVSSQLEILLRVRENLIALITIQNWYWGKRGYFSCLKSWKPTHFGCRFLPRFAFFSILPTILYSKQETFHVWNQCAPKAGFGDV